MICLVLAILAAGLAAASADQALRAQHQAGLLAAQADPRAAFEEWAARHGKSYANDLQAYERRFAAWQDNLDFAIAHNARTTSYWVGMNSLADLTHDEYKAKFGLGRAKYSRASPRPALRLPGFAHASVDGARMPPSVDWRARGAVAEVKNQASCGSCWAFSTTGAVEGINKIATGELLSLSEQYLVDCDTLRDQGCQGGLMDFAFEFVSKHGIELEEDYPYTAEQSECSASKSRRKVTIDGFQDVPNNDEVALKKAVSRQPVSVAIQADQRPFQLYVGGVFDDTACGTQLDHGVLAVGYGSDAGGAAGDVAEGEQAGGLRYHNYWIVKNSWGGAWGDKGFIKMRMGRGHAGLCGIAMQASYPLKAPAPSAGRRAAAAAAAAAAAEAEAEGRRAPGGGAAKLARPLGGAEAVV